MLPAGCRHSRAAIAADAATPVAGRRRRGAPWRAEGGRLPRGARRRWSNLPPPPPPLHHFQQQAQPYPGFPQQYPSAPQQGYPAAAAAESGRGTWKAPLVVQFRQRSNQFLWDVMRICFWFWVLTQFFQINITSGSETSTSKKGEKDEDGKKKDKGEREGFGGMLGSMLGKSEPVKPVDLSTPAHNVRWADVHGCDEAKEELKEVVEFLKEPDRFTRLGGTLPKGFLLIGPPGTGKTMLAKAIAKEANVPFFYSSGAQFEEMFVGVGAKRVRELFAAARKKAPCLVFIDEIDAVGGKRSKFDTSHDRATINQLLAEMDGFHGSESVVVLAATNSPKTLDKALTRPGRFDRTVAVDPPDMRGRTKILEHYLGKVKADPAVEPKVIARGTNGMVGADLANVVNLATLQAAKEGAEHVTQHFLEEAKDRVSMGMEQKSKRIPEFERRNTAYHEAGHALVAIHTESSSPLHKATIRPRGMALGLTMQHPPDDQISMSLKEMHARLRVLMGGRIAEEVQFGRDAVTSGASNDIQQATELARSMVRKFGLSAAMGCVDYSFADDPDGAYLSNKTRRRIEEEVRSMLDTAYSDASSIILDKRNVLEKIAQGLLEKETLTGKEMRMMAGVPEPADQPDPVKK